ncbi:MAG: helix-turn-helix transcriptional regulator, partial [Kiloniellales bacterium]
IEVVNRLIERENPVRVWRKYRGLTQQDLAKKVGVNPADVSQIESGKRGGSSKVLRAIASGLNVDLDDIVPG